MSLRFADGSKFDDQKTFRETTSTDQIVSFIGTVVGTIAALYFFAYTRNESQEVTFTAHFTIENI